MSSTGGLDRLTAAIQTAVALSKKGRAAVQGEIQGDKVLVGTKQYARKLATDLTLVDGDFVWVQITDDDTTAVIVGE